MFLVLAYKESGNSKMDHQFSQECSSLINVEKKAEFDSCCCRSFFQIKLQSKGFDISRYGDDLLQL